MHGDARAVRTAAANNDAESSLCNAAAQFGPAVLEIKISQQSLCSGHIQGYPRDPGRFSLSKEIVPIHIQARTDVSIYWSIID